MGSPGITQWAQEGKNYGTNKLNFHRMSNPSFLAAVRKGLIFSNVHWLQTTIFLSLSLITLSSCMKYRSLPPEANCFAFLISWTTPKRGSNSSGKDFPIRPKKYFSFWTKSFWRHCLPPSHLAGRTPLNLNFLMSQYLAFFPFPYLKFSVLPQNGVDITNQTARLYALST